MIKAVHPYYEDEYHELKRSDELDPEQLDTYFSYTCDTWNNGLDKDNYHIVPGFTFDDLYEIDDSEYSKSQCYRLKENGGYSFVTEDNFNEIVNKLDPNKEMYFLFSIHDNPNWDYQEQLENIGYRMHLG